MDLILRLIAVLGAATTLVMTVLMLVTFRKERKITRLAPLTSMAISLILLPVFMLLSGASLHWLLGGAILVLGLLIGFIRGMATKLRYVGDEVMGKNSLLFIFGWGGSLALAQLFNVFGSAYLASAGLVPVFLSTGTQVGINANLLIRRMTIKPHPAPARRFRSEPQEPLEHTCPVCNALNAPENQFCSQCGKILFPNPIKTCSLCRAENPLDNEFCSQCGGRLS